MDSRRLPRKHLRPLLAGRPMIACLAERLNAVGTRAELVLATSTRAIDDPLADWARETGLGLHRGQLDDVLGRCVGAARAHDADVVVKANGDSPLLAPEVARGAVQHLIAGALDCVTAKNAYTGLPTGLGVEVLSRDALERLDRQVRDRGHREAITSWIFAPDSGFAWAPVPVPPDWRAPGLNLCIDTARDLDRLTAIVERLPARPPAEWSPPDIIAAATAGEGVATGQGAETRKRA